jgi:hypothetical protein
LRLLPGKASRRSQPRRGISDLRTYPAQRASILSTAIHRNQGQAPSCRGTVALIWHWWRQVPRGSFRGGLSWPCSQVISLAGSRSARATSSRAAAEAGNLFASICDTSSFQMAGISSCRSIRRVARARVAATPPGGPGLENNFAQRKLPQTPERCIDSAGWSAPQPPTPHPSGDRPWLHWRRGLPLWALIERTVSATTRRLRPRVRARSPCGAGVGAGLADLSLRDEIRRCFCPPADRKPW